MIPAGHRVTLGVLCIAISMALWPGPDGLFAKDGRSLKELLQRAYQDYDRRAAEGLVNRLLRAAESPEPFDHALEVRRGHGEADDTKAHNTKKSFLQQPSSIDGNEIEPPIEAVDTTALPAAASVENHDVTDRQVPKGSFNSARSQPVATPKIGAGAPEPLRDPATVAPDQDDPSQEAGAPFRIGAEDDAQAEDPEFTAFHPFGRIESDPSQTADLSEDSNSPPMALSKAAGPEASLEDMKPQPLPKVRRGSSEVRESVVASRDNKLAINPDQALARAAAQQIPSVNIEVYFKRGAADLSQGTLALLKAVGRALSDPDLESQRFLIAGHTDAKGKRDSNLLLSAQRARAIRDFLIKNFDIDSDRLIAKGFGEEYPKNPRRPFDDINRRVQIINLTSDLLVER